ncbi:hypothetical protein B0H13DRAFT_2507117 [Mycena leptocephala]|nr:hypothetical protein B0H13DRAFT_2507117 [Mycena leptocephala]
MAGMKDIVQAMPTKLKPHKEAVFVRDTISSSVFSGFLPLRKADAVWSAAEEYAYQRTRTQQRRTVFGCADDIVPNVPEPPRKITRQPTSRAQCPRAWGGDDVHPVRKEPYAEDTPEIFPVWWLLVQWNTRYESHDLELADSFGALPHPQYSRLIAASLGPHATRTPAPYSFCCGPLWIFGVHKRKLANLPATLYPRYNRLAPTISPAFIQHKRGGGYYTRVAPSLRIKFNCASELLMFFPKSCPGATGASSVNRSVRLECAGSLGYWLSSSASALFLQDPPTVSLACAERLTGFV